MLKITDGYKNKDHVTPGLPVTIRIAADQDQFQALPAHAVDGVVAFSFDVTDEDIEVMKEHKKIYVGFLTGGDPVQPVRVEVRPEVFEQEIEYDKAGMRAYFARCKALREKKKLAAAGNASDLKQ